MFKDQISKPIIELRSISKSYGKLAVLKEVDLKIYQGEVTCLLGHSGSGKTTLMRIASSLARPDFGQVIKNGDPRFAYVFQSPRLLPWQTAEENLLFVQKNYGLSKEKKLRDLLFEIADLAGFRKAFPAQLSGGMQQRLELIRAFAVKPDLVFLDEPFKSLDLQTKFNLRQLLDVIQQQSKTTLFLITHDPEAALLLADRIYFLAKEQGITKEIVINIPRSSRKISSPQISTYLEEIIDEFTDLVDQTNYQLDNLKELLVV